MYMSRSFTPKAAEVGQRLDLFCTANIPALSRAAIQRAIKNGHITLNQKQVKPSYALKSGDQIEASQTDLTEAAASLPDDPGSLSLPILYEDQEVVVINKPAGIVVHPGVGVIKPTVASWFADKYPESLSVGENSTRPGLVHRLDKDTSGLMIVAKTQAAYQDLKSQWQRRRVRKEYLALVFKVPSMKEGRIVQPIARSKRNPMRRVVDPTGRPAITEWKTEQKFGNRFALLRLFPKTGRTHQLRVHLNNLHYPIVGDQLYTYKRQRPPIGVTHQLLHAAKLTLRLPSGKRRTFTAQLPDDFAAIIDTLAKAATDQQPAL